MWKKMNHLANTCDKILSNQILVDNNAKDLEKICR